MAAAGQRIATGFALASAASLLMIIMWTADRNDPPETAAPPSPDVVRVGVVEGQSVPGYLDSSRGELASLPADAPTWALVSLSGYVPPGALPSVLSGSAVAQVYARAPIGHARAGVVRIPAYRVPDDVVAGMLATAGARDQERADYGRLSRDLDGAGNNQTRLRRAYARAADTAAAEAHAFRAHCACVFAAVVHADPAALRGIAGRAEVRAVDPAPEVRRLDRVEFRPPLPEQPDSPRTAITPAPGGTSMVATATPTPVPSSLGATVTSASPQQPAAPSAGSGSSSPDSEEHPAVPAAPAPTSPPGAPARSAGEPVGGPTR